MTIRIADHVDDAVRDGVAIAEFPTTMEAAVALHAAGIKVMMGAPNLVQAVPRIPAISLPASSPVPACSTLCRLTTYRRVC